MIAEFCPRALCKEVAPVVGNLAVLSFFYDVVVAIFFIPRKCFFEPLVLVRGMVDHKIHHDSDTALPCLGYQLVEILHRAELRLNGFIIGNIITIVVIRAFINRGEPNMICPQLGNMIQTFNDTTKITNTVAVGIFVRSRIYLINNRIFANIQSHKTPLNTRQTAQRRNCL